LRKRNKSYEYYVPLTRTERDAKPLSKEQIEDAVRKAMKLICKALEENPDLRTDVKEYVKTHPQNKITKIKDVRPQFPITSHNVNMQRGMFSFKCL